MPYEGIADGARLLHHDGSEWVDITLTDQGGVLCAEVTSLSPFAVVESTSAVVPQTIIQTAPPAQHVSPTASFALVSQPASTLQAPVTFECALDTLPGELPDWSSCEPVEVIEGLLFGQHELLVRAVNELNGLFDASPARHVWEVVPPQTTIEDGPDSPTIQLLANFEFSSNDPLATFECSLDDELFGSCETPYHLYGLPTGEHTLAVRAVNVAGGFDPTPAEWNWTISPEPQTTITSAPPVSTNDKTATFEFESDLPGATFECALDGALDDEVWVPCESGITYSNVIFGSHDFGVRARVGDGFDLTPAEHRWEVGGAAPPSRS